jgi:hypothetical protein
MTMVPVIDTPDGPIVTDEPPALTVIITPASITRLAPDLTCTVPPASMARLPPTFTSKFAEDFCEMEAPPSVMMSFVTLRLVEPCTSVTQSLPILYFTSPSTCWVQSFPILPSRLLAISIVALFFTSWWKSFSACSQRYSEPFLSSNRSSLALVAPPPLLDLLRAVLTVALAGNV